MIKVLYFYGDKHSCNYWCVSGKLSIHLNVQECHWLKLFHLCVWPSYLHARPSIMASWGHYEDSSSLGNRSVISIGFEKVLWGWRSCSVSRLSPFLNDQTVLFGITQPCLKGSSPCPFCLLCKLGSRDVCSAGFYLLGDQRLQWSAARDNLPFFNVWIIKTWKVTRTDFVCYLLIIALEAHFLVCSIGGFFGWFGVFLCLFLFGFFWVLFWFYLLDENREAAAARYAIQVIPE